VDLRGRCHEPLSLSGPRPRFCHPARMTVSCSYLFSACLAPLCCVGKRSRASCGSTVFGMYLRTGRLQREHERRRVAVDPPQRRLNLTYRCDPLILIGGLWDIPRTGRRYVAVAMLWAVDLEPSPNLWGTTGVYFSGTQSS
jgi:hypothetical protein